MREARAAAMALLPEFQMGLQIPEGLAVEPRKERVAGDAIRPVAAVAGGDLALRQAGFGDATPEGQRLVLADGKAGRRRGIDRYGVRPSCRAPL